MTLKSVACMSMHGCIMTLTITGRGCVTREAMCMHVHVTPKIFDCPSMSTIGRSCMTIKCSLRAFLRER